MSVVAVVVVDRYPPGRCLAEVWGPTLPGQSPACTAEAEAPVSHPLAGGNRHVEDERHEQPAVQTVLCELDELDSPSVRVEAGVAVMVPAAPKLEFVQRHAITRRSRHQRAENRNQRRGRANRLVWRGLIQAITIVPLAACSPATDGEEHPGRNYEGPHCRPRRL